MIFFRKPVPTFRDHALVEPIVSALLAAAVKSSARQNGRLAFQRIQKAAILPQNGSVAISEDREKAPCSIRIAESSSEKVSFWEPRGC
jgi:hypothetical protein